MTFKFFLVGVAVLSVLLTLSGCPGVEENSATSGLVVHFAEVHMEDQQDEAAVPIKMRATQTPNFTSANLVTAASVAAPGGYDHVNLEHHHIHDKNGKSLSIYRAYLVVDDLELIPCTSVVQLSRKLLNGLIPSAQAHTGHGSEPVGGRALDKPNVIDIVTQDEFILPLGDAAVAPGRYCGMRVSIVRLASEAYGKPTYLSPSSDDPTTMPEVPDLSGKTFALRADYCDTSDGDGVCTHRTKVDIDDVGLTTDISQTVEFDTPLVLSADWREAYVAVGIFYGEWVKDIDVTLLNSDAGERQKLLNNIAASIQVHEKGLGDLPPNIIVPE